MLTSFLPSPLYRPMAPPPISFFSVSGTVFPPALSLTAYLHHQAGVVLDLGSLGFALLLYVAMLPRAGGSLLRVRPPASEHQL